VASTMLIDMSQKDDGDLFDNVSTILASSRLLLTLINNVLDLGKMEAGKMKEIDLLTIAAVPPIIDSIKFCEHFAGLNETRLVLENPEADFTVKANRTRLQQVS